MNHHKLIWTLQSNFPKEWKNKLLDNNLILDHSPLVKLVQTKEVDSILLSFKENSNVIITSPFAAKIIASKISHYCNFFVVGNKSKMILENQGFNVVKISNTARELSDWVKTKNNDTFIHLCSELTDKKIWHSNVIYTPFYKPIDNNKFDASIYKDLNNCTIIFGSPSGVDVWFRNINHIPTCNYACMGETTANRIFDYTNENVIFPDDSSIETLIKLITEKKYENK